MTDLRVQVGRLDERMNGMDKSLTSQIGAIGQKLDSFALEIRTSYATRAELLVVDGKVNDVRDNQKWIVRLVLGTVVLGLIGLVVKFGGVPH